MNAKHKEEAENKVGECHELCGGVPCGKVLSSTNCNVCSDIFNSHDAKTEHFLMHSFFMSETKTLCIRARLPWRLRKAPRTRSDILYIILLLM